MRPTCHFYVQFMYTSAQFTFKIWAHEVHLHQYHKVDIYYPAVPSDQRSSRNRTLGTRCGLMSSVSYGNANGSNMTHVCSLTVWYFLKWHLGQWLTDIVFSMDSARKPGRLIVNILYKANIKECYMVHPLTSWREETSDVRETLSN